MKRSIQLIVLVLMVLCQNIGSAVAQTRSYDGTISVVLVQLEQRGKSVYINIDFVLNDVRVKSAHGDRKSTRLNSSHPNPSRMPSSA